MATIHVNRSGSSLGTFSEEEVREGLSTGRFIGTDLGWREGMAQWLSLSQMPEFGGSAPPPPPPTSVPTSPTGASVVTSAPVAVAPRSGLPWDRRNERGFFSAFFDTLIMVLTKPADAFTAMNREGGFGEPLIYGLSGGCFGYVIYLLFMFFVPSIAAFGDRNNALAGVFGMGIGIVVAIICVPIFLTIGIFLGAGILHVCLMIVGGARQTFETTFRVVCFTVGSTYPLVIVPFCGGMVAFFWGLVLECIGLARAHETETGRAVMAVLLPLIVCCGGGFLLAIMFGAMGAMGHHSGQ